jgi:hypothetical protein
MKNLKIGLILLSISFLCSICLAQDVGMTIATIPPVLAPNQYGQIRVQVDNNGIPENNIPINRIRPSVSVPSYLIEVTGVTLPPGWILCSNDGQTIVLSNGTDGSIAPGTSAIYYIDIKAKNVNGGPLDLQGNLYFGGWQGDPCWNGPPTPGDNPYNNNPETSIIVSGPLPISLASFNVFEKDCQVHFIWKTESEIKSKGFDVEYSVDGKAFESLSFISSKNSIDGAEYSFVTDSDKSSSYKYYRLKLLDGDGSFSYSDVKVLKTSCKKEISLDIYPIPANDMVNVKLSGFEGRELKSAEILDSQGKWVKSLNLYTQEVNKVNIESLNSGVYFLRLVDDISVNEKKFVKIK